MSFYQMPFWAPHRQLCSDVFLSFVPWSFWVQWSSSSQHGNMSIKHSCGCGTGAPAGHGATAASRGHWVKPIWTFAINIKETTTLNGFGIWNQKPNLNVRAGPYLQTKLNWMFRPQLWQRNESRKSKSAFCISAPLVILIILCPFTISNILETLKLFIRWVILPSQAHKNQFSGNTTRKQGQDWAVAEFLLSW